SSSFSTQEDSSLIPALRTRATAHLGVNGPVSIVTFATWQEDRSGGRSTYLVVDAGRTFPAIGHLDLIVSRQTGAVASTSISLQLTQRIGNIGTSSSRVTNQGGSSSVAASLSHSAPPGSGFGYELTSERGAVDNTDGRFTWNGERAAVSGWLQEF